MIDIKKWHTKPNVSLLLFVHFETTKRAHFLAWRGVCFYFEVHAWSVFRRVSRSVTQLSSLGSERRCWRSRATRVFLTDGQKQEEEERGGDKRREPAHTTLEKFHRQRHELPTDLKRKKKNNNGRSIHKKESCICLRRRVGSCQHPLPHSPCLDPTAKLCTPSAASSTSRGWTSRRARLSEWSRLCPEDGGRARGMESGDGSPQVTSKSWR